MNNHDFLNASIQCDIFREILNCQSPSFKDTYNEIGFHYSEHMFTSQASMLLSLTLSILMGQIVSFLLDDPPAHHLQSVCLSIS